MIIQCYIDERTHKTLRRFSKQDGRTIEELAEDAIADAAIYAERDLPATRSGEKERG